MDCHDNPWIVAWIRAFDFEIQIVEGEDIETPF
jgi:hypothetical protein